MLAAHKVIDALLGKDKKHTLMPLVGITPERCVSTAKMIQHAEKFDFGDLMFETDELGWKLPALTSDEKEFWRDGLIPLPAAVCWYEFVIGNSRSGLLITEASPYWYIERLDVNGNEILFDAVVVTLDRKQIFDQVELSGNKPLLDRMKGSKDFMENHLAVSGPLAVYLTLMLNSKSSEVVDVPAPRELNVARKKRGHTPLAAHRIVTIVPKHYSYVKGADGIDRRSPRLHWRRSHLRHLPSGKAIVIARMLVGKAELGEVSHEYRIGNVTT